ncbi:MAG: hypothetical protein A2X13_15350 [Bacteroidetes bacterium GWC2_33_15]|nr:MAG: hypothetical protein A2X10_13650 [Bacteroidetes bacterium GWA2_33_15]OFX49211.1 MAG: hypothetical protein A2X13_15350 [Bacteroidetes bacterium GWC2_33_15]OFX64680.1 MAG: hypothetical protein A2X15_03710 [Bacteroidetes bacterium GWB2_32_14]OFX69112.1 MAG: hypothetical protein A2X14_10205 [Bacteroidetes bacterium GWD2_33_33]HAN17618.1 hypothetical protein [Bacteroidales bacterium]
MEKYKISLVLFFLLFMAGEIKSQSVDEILKSIEANNNEILASKKLLESKTYEYKNRILPDGPEFSYGYFPDNSSTTGPKETFEISQSFQMPCFYRNQSALSRLMTEQERLSYQQIRQSVLFEAKKFLIETVYLTRMSFLLHDRLTDAENLLLAFTKSLETGNVNILEVNKSKLHLLQVQNQLKTVINDLNTVRKQLKSMNGGQDINTNITEYPMDENINLDSIIAEKENIDPEILFAIKQTESSAKMVKVTKNLQLPKFSLGYAGETVADEKFRGFVVGISVPLWGSNSAIKKARFESEYSGLNYQLAQVKVTTETRIQIEKIQNLKSNLDNYISVLSTVNNTALLKKSLELGEISAIDYFMEISYFYQVYDDYLLTEKEYHQAVAKLFTYKL